MLSLLIAFGLGVLCCHFWYVILPYLKKQFFGLEARLQRKKKRDSEKEKKEIDKRRNHTVKK